MLYNYVYLRNWTMLRHEEFQEHFQQEVRQLMSQHTTLQSAVHQARAQVENVLDRMDDDEDIAVEEALVAAITGIEDPMAGGR